MQGISKLSDNWMHKQTIKAKRRNQIKNLVVKIQKTIQKIIKVKLVGNVWKKKNLWVQKIW